MKNATLICLAAWLLAAAAAPRVHADPCGMVPPIYLADDEPIKRIGVQKTYVFYKNGLEAMVLRPGFSGHVDEFGMLIPFPSPPAIRKLPDNVFDQIAAAIDPPEVVVDLTPPQQGGFFGGGFGGGGGGFGGGGLGGLGFQLAKDEVNVIREEAVGMYEVAVLAAGSSAALKRWMDDHKYTYPSGMDVVCPEYIEIGWCFVAVKTKVKQQAASQPQPGQRKIDNDLPDGATFDGYVQAMGFRFRSRRLVVPMRLSVHNPGSLRNVVYLLSDTPSKIRNIPEKFVVRQISGFKLYDQLTRPLPLRIIGGKLADIPRVTARGLKQRRNPQPHNGVAADLFAADLLAAKTQRLASDIEDLEGDLQQIGEALDLRGGKIDEEVRRLLQRRRDRIARVVLRGLDNMTLTVIDGEFPREVLARENLTFARYQMPLKRSSPEFYDAKEMAPAAKKPGILILGALEHDGSDKTQVAATPAGGGRSPQVRGPHAGWLALTIGLGMLALIAVGGRSHRSRLAAVLLLALGGLVTATVGGAERSANLPVLVERLGNANLAEQTAEQITVLGEPAVPAMIASARSQNLIQRGWAIVCLGRIGGDKAMSELKRLTASAEQSRLVRTWAAAAMVKAARSGDELNELAKLVDEFPAISRPLEIAFQQRLRDPAGIASAAGLLTILDNNPELEPRFGKLVLSLGAEPLVHSLLHSDSISIRRKAAAYLATLGNSSPTRRQVAEAVVDGFAFDAEADAVPWDGGPLFLPGLNWPASDARLLVGHLIRWHLWASLHKQPAAQKQIDTNLNSVTLSRLASYRRPSSSQPSSAEWLKAWKAVVGVAEIEQILNEQRALRRYKRVLDDKP